ncbi:MAG: fibronectin type III-like domain-contianing protein, partial [Chitinophagaceae bacterium]|nr:fibronectin type III-like domain-contianing protein [Chitinophagaceae bacterium]
GNAIADVLFGDYNPSAKLAMSFPESIGQIPIYYNHFNTGRPVISDKIPNTSYIDLSVKPNYAFGFGLSYTSFQYSNLYVGEKQMKADGKIEISFTLTNTGKYAGEEIVQLYIRDMVGSIARPVKDLKDFKKIALNAGESKTIEFTIDKEKLSFYNSQLNWVAEPGDFQVMIGASSEDIRLKENFELIK